MGLDRLALAVEPEDLAASRGRRMSPSSRRMVVVLPAPLGPR